MLIPTVQMKRLRQRKTDHLIQAPQLVSHSSEPWHSGLRVCPLNKIGQLLWKATRAVSKAVTFVSRAFTRSYVDGDTHTQRLPFRYTPR